MIEFFVAGPPVPKARARVVRTAKGVRSFTPEKTASYENRVAFFAQQAMRGRAPLASPVNLSVTICIEPPASWSERKKNRATAGEIAPTKKPDASNVLKAIEDAMNKIVYFDDSQIVRLIVFKQYAASPGVHISVQQLEQESA
jgi:Holliday junction resolvase RusA-like endonuclease